MTTRHGRSIPNARREEGSGLHRVDVSLDIAPGGDPDRDEREEDDEERPRSLQEDGVAAARERQRVNEGVGEEERTREERC